MLGQRNRNAANATPKVKSTADLKVRINSLPHYPQGLINMSSARSKEIIYSCWGYTFQTEFLITNDTVIRITSAERTPLIISLKHN